MFTKYQKGWGSELHLDFLSKEKQSGMASAMLIGATAAYQLWTIMNDLTICRVGNCSQCNSMGVHFQLHFCPWNAEHTEGAIAVPCHNMLILIPTTGDRGRAPSQTLAALQRGAMYTRVTAAHMQQRHLHSFDSKKLPLQITSFSSSLLHEDMEWTSTGQPHGSRQGLLSRQPGTLSDYLVQHLKLYHQLHAGHTPNPHTAVLTTGGTVRLTGTECHFIYLQ